MKSKRWLMLGLLCACGPASAQYVIGDIKYTCPVGAHWNDPRCIREPIAGTVQQVPEAPPLGRWRTTWGAIALAESTGDVGVAVGKNSESEAATEAMNRCATHGAIDCTLDFSYENQCAVIASASENGAFVGGAAVSQGGPSIEIASDLALSACKELRNGGECKIAYSDCTKPIFEKF